MDATPGEQIGVGKGTVIGEGPNLTVVNKRFPKHLYTGISLVGKEARVPAGVKVGRNCIVGFGFTGDSFDGRDTLADGESA